MRIPDVLARNGLGHSLRVAYIYFLEPAVMGVVPLYTRLRRKLRTLRRKRGAGAEIRRWESRKEELIRAGGNGYKLPVGELGLASDELERLEASMKSSGEVEIAEIDQDGFFLSRFGPIEGAPCVSEDRFMRRKKFTLKPVAFNGTAGVKKDYKGCRLSFLNELEALHELGLASCNVPSILDVDFENLTLTISFIPGPVLREELVAKGALLRDRDVDGNPDFARLAPEQRRLKRIEEGKRVLHEVVDHRFTDMLFGQMKKIHSAGFIVNDVKYGNVIIERKTGEPYLVDFELSMNFSGLGPACFRVLRDLDIEEFNLHYDADKPTRARVREKLKIGAVLAIENWYVPVYFGGGLRIGPIWNPDSGWGRWYYILKDNLPPLEGKRVLDLGANNAFNSIQMLRHGAREAVGFEISEEHVEQVQFLKSVFEWADNREYSFRYVQGDMAGLPSMDLGKFDFAIALCSIYYLDDDSIARVIRHISTVSEYFVIQCNTVKDIGRSDPHTYEKATVEYLKNALESNGFPEVRVVAPRGYPRPLLIGSKGK